MTKGDIFMICRCFCCLFEKDGVCTHKEPSIDKKGHCAKAIILKPERSYIERLKERFSNPEIMKIEMP